MLSLSLALLFVAQAEAAPERLHVEWVAPEGCPSREALASALEDSVPADRTFHASVRIDSPAAAGEPWRAVVVTTADGVQRTRVVKSSDCVSLSKAAVLVVKLVATRLPLQEEPEFSTSPAPSSTPKAVAPQVLEEAEEGEGGAMVSPSQPFSFRLRVQPLVGANAGVFPLPAVSAGLGVSLMKGRIRAQLALASWAAIRPSGRGIAGTMTSITLKGCWLFEPREVVRIGPCATLEVGPMSVVGTGVAMPQANSVLWGALLTGATAGFAVTKSISVWGTAEVGVNAVRPRFVVTTPTDELTVHQMGWPVGRVTMGLEFELTIP